MVKRLVRQTSFNAGEISPRLYAREDVDKYSNAVKTATNFEILPQGPMRRRNGSQYINEVKTSADEARLIRFQFSSDDGIVIEAGNTYFRFYRNGAQITSGGTPIEIATPYSDTDVQDLQYVQFGDLLYLAHPSYPPRVLTRESNTSWTLSELTLLPEPTVEIGELPNTTVTPGAISGSGVTFTAGAADTFLDADVGRQIINLSGSGRASITAVAAGGGSATCDIVEEFPNTSAIASQSWKLDLSPIAALTPSGTKVGSIITIDADVTGTSTTALETFSATDVGRYIKLNNGVVVITAVGSSSSISAEVLKSLDSLDETENWTLEDPAWSSTRGYPRAIGFHEQRLIFGGTTAQPQTIWFSETGIFDGFGVGSDDDDSIEVELASNEANQIQWFASGRELVVGTAGSETTITTGGAAGPITSSNIQARQRTRHGSSTQQPITIRNEIVFVNASKKKLMSFLYDFETDGFLGEDLLFLAEHITTDNIVEAVYVQDPDSQIYAVLEDGNMIVGAYDRKQKVIGWSTFTTDGNYEHITTIKRNGIDEVWVIVKRTINGSDVRYIELFDNGNGTDYQHSFLDSFLTLNDAITISGITQANPGVVTATSHGLSDGDQVRIKEVVGMTELNNDVFTVANSTTHTFELTNSSGSNIDTSSYTAYSSGGEAHKLVTTISNLDHLEGKTVAVCGDGADQASKVVSGGAITAAIAAGEFVVGLPVTTTLTTLNKNYNIGLGSMQGQRTRYARPILRLYKSGIPTLNGEMQPSRIPTQDMDEAVALYSTDIIYGPTDFDTTGQLTITIGGNKPLVLLGIFGSLDGGAI